MNYTVDKIHSETPTQVYLELVDNEVNIMVEQDGDHWYIATLTKDGKLEKCIDIPKSLGLKLDKQGCIVTTVEGE